MCLWWISALREASKGDWGASSQVLAGTDAYRRQERRAERRELWRQLGANPGATLEQHRGFGGSKSGKVSIVTMSRGMRKELECKGFAFYG